MSMLAYALGTRQASEALIRDLYIDLREKVNAWSEITCQTPQARMGYIGQHLVSVVTGFPGGKSGARGYDLVMGDGRYGEIKTCYRVDQLGSCRSCGAVVSSMETQCARCGSRNISRKDDSKWLIGLRNEDEFARVLQPFRYYFVLFEFVDLANSSNNDIEASIWEVDPLSCGFAFCMVDYYMNIRANSPSKAPFNMWPHELKFSLTRPVLIYRSLIRTDGRVDTQIFPDMGNTYPEELLPLEHYARAKTITAQTARQIVRRLSGKRADGWSKTDCLAFLEQLRKARNIPNGLLCDTFSEEIYLPLIAPLRDRIPASIREHFAQLQ